MAFGYYNVTDTIVHEEPFYQSDEVTNIMQCMNINSTASSDYDTTGEHFSVTKSFQQLDVANWNGEVRN